MIVEKLGILRDVIMGNLIKLKVRYSIYIKKHIVLSEKRDQDIIVTLTSYGERVKGSAVYTIYSILKQTVLPERIVLWLDEKEYGKDNLPDVLLFLEKYGLEVRFVPDLGPYTKIIHALKGFPNKHLITVDDDIYYSKQLIEELKMTHCHYPKAIVSGWAKVPTKDIHQQLSPYTEWPEYHHVDEHFEYDTQTLFPLGWSGVLYPAHTFDIEVMNAEVFTRLCPKADDIWLYVMGLRCKTEKRILTHSNITRYHTDLLRQLMTKDRLTAINRFGGENDKQLAAVHDYYEERKNIKEK